MKIGNLKFENNVFLAPMAGVADRSFRELCAGFGAGYVVSEMVSSKGISYSSQKSASLMELGEGERPAGVQLFGSEPDTMAQAAEFALEYSPDVIDINMGCPAPKISSSGSGSALMKTPQLCGEIVQKVKKMMGDTPLTVKIRKGWDDESVNAVAVAKICQQAGADAITIHGRTRQQFYSGKADLDIIREVKGAVSVPVIGNGDITNAFEAERMLEYTGCDAIMVGRGALGNPFIFREINMWLNHNMVVPPVSLEEKLTIILRHIKNLCEYKGEYIGMKEARKHVAWYFKGLKNAAKYRKYSGELNTLKDLEGLIVKVHKDQTIVVT